MHSCRSNDSFEALINIVNEKESFQKLDVKTFTSSSALSLSRLRLVWHAVYKYRISTSFANANYYYYIYYYRYEFEMLVKRTFRRKMFSLFFLLTIFMVDQRAIESILKNIFVALARLFVFDKFNFQLHERQILIINDEMLMLWVKQARFSTLIKYIWALYAFDTYIKGFKRRRKKIKGKSRKCEQKSINNKTRMMGHSLQLIAYIVTP